MRRLGAFITIWILSMGLAFSTGNQEPDPNPPIDATAAAPASTATPMLSDVVSISEVTSTLPFVSLPQSTATPVIETEATSTPQASPTADTNGLDVRGVYLRSILTGPDSFSRTDLNWNIAGTDLGFSFEHDETLYMVFGDTWGRDGVEGVDWRSNVMVTLEPHEEHGYVIADAISDESGDAIELLHSLKAPRREYTVIPNGGVSVDGRMYLHYVSVGNWKKHSWGYKEPIVNYSGIAWSDDDGHTWTKDEHAVWDGDTPFAHAAMLEHDGHIYLFGTPASRFGPARLLRVDSEHLLDPSQYEYWDGSDWNDDPYSQVDVVPGPVGEMSVRWSEYHERWIMMYKNEIDHTIVLRTAENLEGPWDDERVVTTSDDYKSLYAPMLLPIEGPEIQFAMSVFLPKYQVYLMELTLD